MYAIVKTGGKQYRVEEGQSLLVERLHVDDGAKIGLEPLLYVDGSNVVDGDDLGKVKVEARVVGHERGPKLRVVKFKPKRGYKRRTGHRQELTRLQVTSLKLGARRSAAKAPEQPKPVTVGSAAAEPTGDKPAPQRSSARKPATTKAAAAKPATTRAAAAKPAAAKAEAAKPAGETADAPKRAARKPATRRPRTTKPKTEGDNGA
jgi:large subunit ribosomal protein L21